MGLKGRRRQFINPSKLSFNTAEAVDGFKRQLETVGVAHIQSFNTAEAVDGFKSLTDESGEILTDSVSIQPKP